MKTIYLFLIMICIPFALFAQYSGGNGKGDASYEANGLVLTINENQALSFTLLQNFPNPVTETSSIVFILPEKIQVKLMLYDILGRQVKILIDEVKGPGRFKCLINARDLEDGLYFYKITAGNYSCSRSLEVRK